VDHERADRGRNGPDSQLRRFDVDPILIEKSTNQKDRAYGNEDIFAKEQGDVVDCGGVARMRNRVLCGSSP